MTHTTRIVVVILIVYLLAFFNGTDNHIAAQP